MSLWTDAQNKNLPEIQNMDLETLEWIKKEGAGIVIEIANLDQNNLEAIAIKFIPAREWFSIKEKVDSLHGLRHLIRVGVYSHLLFKQSEEDRPLNLNVVVTAAVLHDIKRESDKEDAGHAERAANWFLNNKNLVTKLFNIELTENEVKAVFYSILFHELPQDKIDIEIYRQYKFYIDLLKTADALDRYIQPKKKWWINEEFLTLKPTAKLKSFAVQLVLKSEKLFLKGENSVNSIINSLPV